MSADPQAQPRPVLASATRRARSGAGAGGRDVLLQVRVSGAAGDLSGGRIEVVAGEEIVATAVLMAFATILMKPPAFAVRAPARLEAFSWTIRFPPQEIGGIAYEGSALPVLFANETAPHQPRGVVGPLAGARAERFAVTVGARVPVPAYSAVREDRGPR